MSVEPSNISTLTIASGSVLSLQCSKCSAGEPIAVVTDSLVLRDHSELEVTHDIAAPKVSLASSSRLSAGGAATAGRRLFEVPLLPAPPDDDHGPVPGAVHGAVPAAATAAVTARARCWHRRAPPLQPCCPPGCWSAVGSPTLRLLAAAASAAAPAAVAAVHRDQTLHVRPQRRPLVDRRGVGSVHVDGDATLGGQVTNRAPCRWW